MQVVVQDDPSYLLFMDSDPHLQKDNLMGRIPNKKKFSYVPSSTKKPDKKLIKLNRLAQKGDVNAQEYFLKLGCKVYTHEEIYVLNNYLLKEKENKMPNSNENIILIEEPRFIELPDLYGNNHTARLNWIKNIGEDYFRAGLTYVCGHPYEGGSTEWVLKLDEEKGFIPLFCSLYWDVDKNPKLPLTCFERHEGEVK